MINIVVFCNPNYTNKQIINTVKKGNLDIVSQFIVLYESIKKNWTNFEYTISLFHNKNILFNELDQSKLDECEIDIYDCDPDHENLPWYCRCACFETELKNKGTHRLCLDCDMIALNNPKFELECDWQAMFAGALTIDMKYIKYICDKFNYNFDYDKKYKTDNLFTSYITNNTFFKSLFPHFNGGAMLIKEEFCKKFVELWKPSISLSLNEGWLPLKEVPHNVKHIALQYSMSFSLLALSDNWKPFNPGFNYLIKTYDINKFGKNNISLVHYCGSDAQTIAMNSFSEYF